MDVLSLNVLAAGSLRSVWRPLMQVFTQQTGIAVHSQFGPAGLLRQRIEQGESVDLFASANLAHPQSLLAQGLAQGIASFTSNRLCLTVRRGLKPEHSDWLEYLRDRTLRIGTSTPLADPSGDYTWQLFARLEQQHPGLGEQLRQLALPLVGGAQSAPVPEGELAAAWLIRSNQCDMFIGYASYGRRLEACADLQLIAIPEEDNIQADYALAQCSAKAAPLSEFILSTTAQEYLRREGFAERP